MENTPKKDTVRLNFEFPKQHYPYLKMMCAKKGTTLRNFASELLIQALEDYEDQILAKKAQKHLDEINEDDLIDFDEAIRLAGWYDDKEV